MCGSSCVTTDWHCGCVPKPAGSAPSTTPPPAKTPWPTTAVPSSSPVKTSATTKSPSTSAPSPATCVVGLQPRYPASLSGNFTPPVSVSGTRHTSRLAFRHVSHSQPQFPAPFTLQNSLSAFRRPSHSLFRFSVPFTLHSRSPF